MLGARPELEEDGLVRATVAGTVIGAGANPSDDGIILHAGRLGGLVGRASRLVMAGTEAFLVTPRPKPPRACQATRRLTAVATHLPISSFINVPAASGHPGYAEHFAHRWLISRSQNHRSDRPAADRPTRQRE